MPCEKCGRGFTQFDELQVHILTDHAEDYSTFALFGGPGFQNGSAVNTTDHQEEKNQEEKKQEETREEKLEEAAQ